MKINILIFNDELTLKKGINQSLKIAGNGFLHFFLPQIYKLKERYFLPNIANLPTDNRT